MGTDILELKLDQELVSIGQYPPFLVFLDLRKAYETVDWGILLTTLVGYITGPHMRELPEEFWEWQEVVTCKIRYHGPTSKQLWGQPREV